MGRKLKLSRYGSDDAGCIVHAAAPLSERSLTSLRENSHRSTDPKKRYDACPSSQ